jgi:hypothetical protein
VLFPVFYIAGGALLLAYTKARVGNLVFNTLLDRGRVALPQQPAGAQARDDLRREPDRDRHLAGAAHSLGRGAHGALSRGLPRARGRGRPRRFVGDMSRQVDATGEEMGEMFDVDLSL